MKGYHAYDIDKKREALSKVLPMLQEKGLIDINEFALSMIEAVNLLIMYLEILNKVIDLEDFLYYNNNNTFHCYMKIANNSRITIVRRRFYVW